MITHAQNIVEDTDRCDKMEEPTVHDEEFYIDTADCVVRVENMLFKVRDGAESNCLLPLAITPLHSQIFISLYFYGVDLDLDANLVAHGMPRDHWF